MGMVGLGVSGRISWDCFRAPFAVSYGALVKA